MGAAFVANAWLTGSSTLYWLTFWGQVLFYAATLVGFLLARTRHRPPALSTPHGFCLLNVVALVSTARFLTGSQKVMWQKASEFTELGTNPSVGPP